MGPTQETIRHTKAQRSLQQLVDSEGSTGWPYRAELSFLHRLEQRGVIDSKMREAAERFNATYFLAGLDPLKAGDMGRLPGGIPGSGDSPRIEHARRRVQDIMALCGGLSSPAGSCLWNVVGGGVTLAAWSTHEGWGGRSLHQVEARGVLLATLGMVSGYYERGPQRHQPRRAGR